MKAPAPSHATPESSASPSAPETAAPSAEAAPRSSGAGGMGGGMGTEKGISHYAPSSASTARTRFAPFLFRLEHDHVARFGRDVVDEFNRRQPPINRRRSAMGDKFWRHRRPGEQRIRIFSSRLFQFR